jgi:hypothetical protein
MTQPDYKNYTTEELTEALESINQTRFPDRFEALQQEIQTRQKCIDHSKGDSLDSLDELNEIEQSETNDPDTHRYIKPFGLLFFIPFISAITIFTWAIFQSWQSGFLPTRGYTIVLSKSPFLFYLHILFGLGFIIYVSIAALFAWLKNPYRFTLMGKPPEEKSTKPQRVYQCPSSQKFIVNGFGAFYSFFPALLLGRPFEGLTPLLNPIYWIVMLFFAFLTYIQLKSGKTLGQTGFEIIEESYFYVTACQIITASIAYTMMFNGLFYLF